MCASMPAEKMGLLKIETKETVATRIAVGDGDPRGGALQALQQA